MHVHYWYEVDPPSWRNLWKLFATQFAYACRYCPATKVDDCAGNMVATGFSWGPVSISGLSLGGVPLDEGEDEITVDIDASGRFTVS